MDNGASWMIELRGAFLKTGSDDEVILNGLNMRVKKNEIYGLLGPSGCGKTTILKCILGHKTLHGGEIKIGVERRRDVGYMPQEDALFTEFTIKELFSFYGKLFNLSEAEIIGRSKELTKLLNLPCCDSFVTNLSGGEKRRVSFAAATLHNPKLLILDEPTVGVDSLIANSVWGYLKKLATEGTTILITTHYIEEARSCNTVSFMRKGVLLSECPPSDLIVSQNSSTLEEAFLSLCKLQTEAVTGSPQMLSHKPSAPFQNSEMFNINRFQAQLMRNICWLKRNVTTILSALILPMVILFLFFTCFGKTPRGVKIAFLSDELNYNENCNDSWPEFSLNTSLSDEFQCNFQSPFTCHYIKELEKKLSLVFYQDVETAEIDAVQNKVWGSIHVHQNFSSLILQRVRDRIYTSDSVLEDGVVTVQIDMTDYAVSAFIRREISGSLINAVKMFFLNCGIPDQALVLPIRLRQINTGSSNKEFLGSFVPAFMSSIAFYCTVVFTSAAISTEKFDGTFERNKTAGMTYLEIVGALLVVQCLIMIAQMGILMFITYFCYNQTLLGEGVILFLLLLAVCILGITTAFLLTEVCPSDRILVHGEIATVFLVFTFSGVVWPLEGASSLIRAWIRLLPVTTAAQSYFNLALKGYTVNHYSVYKGFIACFIWSLVIVFMTFMIVKCKKCQWANIFKKCYLRMNRNERLRPKSSTEF